MKRVVTALVLLPVFVYIAVWAPAWLFFAALAIVGILSFREYGDLIAHHNLRPPGLFGYVAGVAVLFLPRPEFIFLTLIALLALALSMTSRELPNALPFAAALVFGVAYIFGSLRTAAGLREFSALWLLFALSCNWVGDVAALYIGKAFGRHKLAPRISPGKTWEGAAASLVLTIVYAYFYFGHLIHGIAVWQALVIGAVANVAGQIGDLCESAIKRGAGVKDSGHMLPGHGGWLDRIDSSLFSMPVVYYMASVLIH